MSIERIEKKLKVAKSARLNLNNLIKIVEEYREEKNPTEDYINKALTEICDIIKNKNGTSWIIDLAKYIEHKDASILASEKINYVIEKIVWYYCANKQEIFSLKINIEFLKKHQKTH